MMVHYKTAIASDKWKMRETTLEQIIELATHFNVNLLSIILLIALQSVEIFTKHMEQIYFTYLKDKAFTIRTFGAQNLKVIKFS